MFPSDEYFTVASGPIPEFVRNPNSVVFKLPFDFIEKMISRNPESFDLTVYFSIVEDTAYPQVVRDQTESEIKSDLELNEKLDKLIATDI